MATLADIRKAAEGHVFTSTDDTTPDDTFYATAKVLGIATTYLLAGQPGDLSAPVAGRIEHTDTPTCLRGTGIKGGIEIHGDAVASHGAAFAAMIAG